MTPEGKTKKDIKKILDAYKPDLWYFMPVNKHTRGIPDFVGCYKGKFFSIEAKSFNGTVTELQSDTINTIKKAGGTALVIRDADLPTLRAWLERT